jgi:hypothetical protein
VKIASRATESPTRTVVLSLGFCAFILFCPTRAGAEHWKLYHISESHFCFYDVNSVARYKKTVRVSEKWVVRQIKKHNLLEAIKEMDEIDNRSGRVMSDDSYRDRINSLAVQETKRLFEIRCLDRMYRIISGIDCDRQGTVIDGLPSSKWNSVKPDSIMESLYKKVCQDAEGQKHE